MKLKKTISAALVALGLVSLINLTSCKKKTSETPANREETENLTMASQEDATADLLFTEIHEQELGMLEEIGTPGIGLNETETTLDTVGRCLKVTVVPRDLTVFPKTITFDFGTGCTGRDGKTRKGKMITVYSAPMFKPGATAVTTFDGFYVNNIHVQGKHTTKNNSTSDVRVFTRTVQDGKLTFPSGGVIVWNATHTNKQIDGLGTPLYPLDDVFEITGSARGIFENANRRIEWSRVIDVPLRKALLCRWISKGVVHIKINDNKATLNFGDGECDNKAVIFINGERKEITL